VPLENIEIGLNIYIFKNIESCDKIYKTYKNIDMVEVLLEVHNNFPKKSQKGIINTSKKKKIQKVFDV